MNYTPLNFGQGIKTPSRSCSETCGETPKYGHFPMICLAFFSGPNHPHDEGCRVNLTAAR